MTNFFSTYEANFSYSTETMISANRVADPNGDYQPSINYGALDVYAKLSDLNDAEKRAVIEVSDSEDAKMRRIKTKKNSKETNNVLIFLVLGAVVVYIFS